LNKPIVVLDILPISYLTVRQKGVLLKRGNSDENRPVTCDHTGFGISVNIAINMPMKVQNMHVYRSKNTTNMHVEMQNVSTYISKNTIKYHK
jgi:hypothetical protein